MKEMVEKILKELEEKKTERKLDSETKEKLVELIKEEEDGVIVVTKKITAIIGSTQMVMGLGANVMRSMIKHLGEEKFDFMLELARASDEEVKKMAEECK